MKPTKNQPGNMNMDTSGGDIASGNSTNADGAIAQGQSARAVGRGGIMIDGNLNGNIYKGLNVDELVDALKKCLPQDDTRPERFRMLLKQFPVYHNKLFEWKELHNCLDEILNALEPFSAEIQRADSEKKIPSLRTLRNLWRPVSVRVDCLLLYARQIEYIGEKYENLGDRFVGEIWAVKINELRNRINAQIGLDESSGFDLSAQHMIGILDKVKLRFDLKPDWWVVLYEMNNEFNHLVYGQMHWTDKKLRETAADLYQHSKDLFGSQA